MSSHLPIWEQKADQWLQPYTALTNLLLVGIIAVSVYMLVFARPTAKTAWVVYMLAP